MSALTIVERLQMFFLVCQGIGYAHSKGVIHRDLKPANIFLKGDLRTPVIGDFGICFIDDDGERVTMVDEVAGSRWYTAPELSHGMAESVTSSADVYSLGKVLYWMLAGRIFDREIHRDKRFDLTKNATRPDYFFIYDLFDKTVVEDLARRISNVTEVADTTDSIIRRIQMNAHHIDLSTPQACTYCGVGFYQPVVNDPERMLYPLNYSKTKNFGLEPKGNFEGPSDWIPFWLVLVYDYCGNVQMFRPDYAKDKEIWRKH